MATEPALVVEHLHKFFPVERGLLRKTVGYVRAVDDVSFELAKGECLGLVGESGCGKTTLARCILRLIDPDSGRVLLHVPDKIDITRATREELRLVRRGAQMIFQDPFSSLDPRWSVSRIVAEPLVAQGVTPREAIRSAVEILPVVGLSDHFANRYPHELSGGERQRVGIARALIVQPSLVVADEPVSALDVSVRAQILNLLLRLQVRMGLAYVFVAHDLSVVRHISDRIAVMYLGQLVEIGTRSQVSTNALHPYTQALMASVLLPDPKMHSSKLVLEGEVPSPMNPPPGCRFSNRCSFARDVCRETLPEMREIESGHLVRCHLAD